MNVPKDLLYTEEHEWIRVKGNRGIIGITDFAQSQLGDVVFVELPKADARLKKGDTFGVVESVKTVSDLYAPASGKVVAVNKDLEAKPELVNADPYGKGWIVEVELPSTDETKGLMTPEQYESRVKEETA